MAFMKKHFRIYDPGAGICKLSTLTILESKGHTMTSKKVIHLYTFGNLHLPLFVLWGELVEECIFPTLSLDLFGLRTGWLRHQSLYECVSMQVMQHDSQVRTVYSNTDSAFSTACVLS